VKGALIEFRKYRIATRVVWQFHFSRKTGRFVRPIFQPYKLTSNCELRLSTRRAIHFSVTIETTPLNGETTQTILVRRGSFTPSSDMIRARIVAIHAATRAPTIWIFCAPIQPSGWPAGGCPIGVTIFVRNQPCGGWRMRLR
jgi:hypothetical protein